jgi:hypothetical protein
MRSDRIVFLVGALVPASFGVYLLLNHDGSGAGVVLLMLSAGVTWMAFSEWFSSPAFERALDKAWIVFRRTLCYLAALWFASGAAIMWLHQPGSFENLVGELALLGAAAGLVYFGNRGAPKP